MTDRPAIELQGLTKRYGQVHAVGPIDLAVTRGEFLSLLGPSGCGKTTTLRLIAGLEAPTGGEIVFDGRRVTRVPTHHRGVGLVFQSYALFPHRTVFDNIAFGLRVRHVGGDTIRQRVDRAIDQVGLTGLQRRYPAQLSGGQQQRVALARAIVYEPDLLLFDEPLSNLDSKLREQMRTELRNLTRSLGITSIYVTHDQTEALALSDRIAVLNLGLIVQIGSPTEIYDRPASEFVADFIGSANLLAAEVSGGGGGVVATTPDGLKLEVRAESGARAGPALLLIRPERVQVSAAEPPTAGPNRLMAEVEDVTYMGAATRYTLRLGTGSARLAAVVDRTLPGTARGQRVWVTIAAEDIALVPRTTGDGPR